MKKLIMSLTVVAFLFVATSSLEAAPIQNIGIVNFKTCVENSKVGQKEQQNFESMKKQMEDVLVEKEKTLNEIATKFNDPDYLDSLSPEAEAEMKHKFRTHSQELQQHQNQYYQVLNQANFKVIQKIGENITEASKVVAENKNLDIVLNEEMAFFHTDALDISNEVVTVMDQLYKEDK